MRPLRPYRQTDLSVTVDGGPWDGEVTITYHLNAPDRVWLGTAAPMVGAALDPVPEEGALIGVRMEWARLLFGRWFPHQRVVSEAYFIADAVAV